jgi:hypothetical protein
MRAIDTLMLDSRTTGFGLIRSDDGGNDVLVPTSAFKPVGSFTGSRKYAQGAGA